MHGPGSRSAGATASRSSFLLDPAAACADQAIKTQQSRRYSTYTVDQEAMLPSQDHSLREARLFLPISTNEPSFHSHIEQPNTFRGTWSSHTNGSGLSFCCSRCAPPSRRCELHQCLETSQHAPFCSDTSGRQGEAQTALFAETLPCICPGFHFSAHSLAGLFLLTGTGIGRRSILGKNVDSPMAISCLRQKSGYERWQGGSGRKLTRDAPMISQARGWNTTSLFAKTLSRSSCAHS